MSIMRIISGAKPGADQGAIEAALWCQIPYGGRIPKGRRCEFGLIPLRYEELTETTSTDFAENTEANIRASDCTVLFTLGTPTGAQRKTLELVERHQKQWLHIDLAITPRLTAVAHIHQWLHGEMEVTYAFEAPMPDQVAMFVAGSPETQAVGIQEMVASILVDVLRATNQECHLCRPLPAEVW